MAADIPEMSTPLERCTYLLQRDLEGPNGGTPIPTTALLHSPVLRQEERLRLEQWQGNWKLMTV